MTTTLLPPTVPDFAPPHAFYVTFGTRWRFEPHPRWIKAHPDGWLTVIAVDAAEAREFLRGFLGGVWAGLHEEPPGRVHYPRGELGRIVAVPAAAAAPARTAVVTA